jgi:hypothetical protein
VRPFSKGTRGANRRAASKHRCDARHHPGEPAKILDIAAGHGPFGIYAALHNPAAEITFQDLDNVLGIRSPRKMPAKIP